MGTCVNVSFYDQSIVIAMDTYLITGGTHERRLVLSLKQIHQERVVSPPVIGPALVGDHVIGPPAAVDLLDVRLATHAVDVLV